MFTCAYLTYDEFVHVNIKTLPQSRAVRLPRRGNSARCLQILQESGALHEGLRGVTQVVAQGDSI
jgi:hypothetical protein